MAAAGAAPRPAEAWPPLSRVPPPGLCGGAARARAQGAVGLLRRRGAGLRGPAQPALRRHPPGPRLPQPARPHGEADHVGARRHRAAHRCVRAGAPPSPFCSADTVHLRLGLVSKACDEIVAYSVLPHPGPLVLVFSLIIEQSCITSFRFTHFDYCSLLAGMGTRRPVLPHCLPVSGMSPFYLSLGDLCDLWQQPSRPFPGASWQCLWTVALQKPGLSLQHPQPPLLQCRQGAFPCSWP